MEERLIRLEQDNNALRRTMNALERKLREIEMQIRKLDRIQQQKRTRGIR
jgi:hypothetical protein